MIKYDKKWWFVDSRLRQLRNVEEPGEYRTLHESCFALFTRECEPWTE